MPSPKGMPVLDHLRQDYLQRHPRPTPAPYVFLVIQHLLADAPSLIRSLLALGCEPEDMEVVGIWYSTKPNIVKWLRGRDGLPHVSTPSNDGEMDACIAEIVPRLLEKCRSTGKRLVIVEDGGYAVPFIHEHCVGDAQLVVGAVEQTTRGKWKDERVAKRGKLLFPVISIPDCALKRVFEPPFVAEAAVTRLSDILLNSLEDSLRDKDITLIGYGSVGSAVAGDLRNAGARVSVWDRDAVRRAAASASGFAVLPNDHTFESAQIIIGATGAMDGPSIREEHFRRHAIADQTVLASVSSRREEIDMAYLAAHTQRYEMRGVGGRYQFQDRREIVVVADGTPLNFYQAESATSRAMQLILALLFDAAQRLVDPQSKLESRIIPGSQALNESHLAELWLDVKRDRLNDPRFFKARTPVGASLAQATIAPTQ